MKLPVRRRRHAPPPQPLVPATAKRVAAPPIATPPSAKPQATAESRALVALVAVAFCFGLMEMYSASAIMARADGLPSHYFAVKQLQAAGLGVLVASLVSRVDYRRIRLWAWPLLAVVMVMLVIVIAPGTHAIAPVRNGARRWLDLGVSFQPSELAKLTLIAWTAMMVVKKEDRLHSLRKGLFPFLVVWVPVMLLVFMQPNLSAALLIALLAGLVLFAGGGRVGHFIALGVIAVPVILSKLDDASYRVKRIIAFLDPSADPLGIRYQINQSLISIGSGGLGGVGFGNSRQKFGFLPEAHNDFLFAMIAEEWGLLGVLFVVALFVAILVVGYRIAARAPDRFGYLLAVGMTNLLVVTAFLHMGVTLSIVPNTGFTLPFMSYGGSALLTYFVAVGVLLSVARHGRGAAA